MMSRAGALGLLVKAAAVLTLSVLAPAGAAAHAPPQVLDIVWTEGQGLVLVTNRGLIFGEPSAQRYRLLCNDALHSTVTDVLSAVALPDGRLLVATYAGLIATRDEGCTSQPVEPLGHVQTTALAADDEARLLFVASYAPGAGGVWRSDDHAATFQRVLSTSDVDFVRSLRVAGPVQGNVTVYASGSLLKADGSYTHYVQRSLDSGDTWQRFEVAVRDDELDVTLLAVSASDARLVVAKATSLDPLTVPERLLISRDGGETFTSPFALPSLAHAELSSDGATLWVAGLTGLFHSDDFATFAPIAGTAAMTYVGVRGGTLYIAGRYAGLSDSSNGVATTSNDGAEPQHFLELNEVRETVSCEPGTETPYLCETPWRDWQRELLDPNAWTAADAGVSVDASAQAIDDAGSDASAQPPVNDDARRRTSSCAASPSNDTSYALLLAYVGLVLGMLRKH